MPKENKPLFVDSHAHLGMEDFDIDRDEVIQRAFQEGISAILCPAEITDPRNLSTTLELTETYGKIIAAGGVHPHHAGSCTPACAQKIEELAAEKKIHAVGEIGLDFHYDFSPREAQISAFRQQLNTAQRLGLPAIIHSRKAADTIAQAVQEEGFTRGGILHCFTEDWEFARRMMDSNFLISFSGILTFPNAHALRETARKIPLDRILIETDSPYLVPVPLRGKQKRNEPVFVKETAWFLAGLLQIPVEKLAEATAQNFSSIFRSALPY